MGLLSPASAVYELHCSGKADLGFWKIDLTMALQRDPTKLFNSAIFLLASMIHVLISLPLLLVLPKFSDGHGPLSTTNLPFSALPSRGPF